MRLLSGFLLALLACSAYAQTSAADAPVEQASPVVVVLFLVMFVGACAAFVGYTACAASESWDCPVRPKKPSNVR